MALETRRLYQQIADEVRELIANGEFTKGSRLPAERELAHRLGVSRPSLREALIALEIDGRVEVRMGSGVYVTSTVGRDTSPTQGLGESAADLMQARAVLEGGLTCIAASRMSDAALTDIKAALVDMAADVAAGRSAQRNDRLFHIAIATAVGNGVMIAMVAKLFDQRHDPIIRKMQARFESIDTWAAALAEHEAIVAALSERDAWRAQAAMVTHLYRSRERWVGE